jgi:hypothetical protein
VPTPCLLDAGGQLKLLRDRLRQLRAPSARHGLPSPEQRLDLNHAVRHGEQIPRDQALYVDALELTGLGVDPRNDRRARRTMAALADELLNLSTLENHFVLAGLQLFADLAEPVLVDLACDNGNISPWRPLRALSVLPTTSEGGQRRLLRMLDPNDDAGLNLKGHGAVLSALDDMDVRLGARAAVLRPLIESPACYPETRVCGRSSAAAPRATRGPPRDQPAAGRSQCRHRSAGRHRTGHPGSSRCGSAGPDADPSGWHRPAAP